MKKMVGVKGFEPSTPTSRSARAQRITMTERYSHLAPDILRAW